jgi:hypothetical protein
VEQQSVVIPEPAQPTPHPTLAPSLQTYPVTPELAAQIALNIMPVASLIQTPELVSYERVVAYEVLLDRGPVYVDASTGKMLNSVEVAAVAPATSGGAQYPSSDRDDSETHEREHEHEEGEHDND